MSIQYKIGATILAGILLLASGCANMPGRDPVEVYVAGIEPLPGEGLELRMVVKLRVQNPNDTAIEYDGIHVNLNLQGKRFASGVSDAAGRVPRFGEAVIEVPLSVSAFRMVRGAIDVFGPRRDGKIQYQLQGKLAGPLFNSVRFTSQGEMTLPEGLYQESK